MFLYEFEGSRGVCLYILLYLLNRLSVLLLMHYIPFLLKRHLIFELQRYLTLGFKSLPCLTVLSLPILRRHRTLYLNLLPLFDAYLDLFCQLSGDRCHQLQ